MSLSWNQLADQTHPSWYLDPVVAQQKREIHQELIRRWLGRFPTGRVLKTDLFEDAWGRDAIVYDLFDPDSALLFGTDIAPATLQAVRARAGSQRVLCFASDIRQLPIARSTFDAIVSTSTLDHFKTNLDFSLALKQLCDALKPGGKLVITLDNPYNPLYWALRLTSCLRISPYHLGYTPRPATLIAALRARSLQVSDRAWLIHNPRLISTALVLMMRLLLRRRADQPIRGMLRLFALQAGLWPQFSACFYGVLVIKPATKPES